MLTFDIETNAINFKAADPIAEIEVIHCIVIQDERGETYHFNDQPGGGSITAGLRGPARGFVL